MTGNYADDFDDASDYDDDDDDDGDDDDDDDIKEDESIDESYSSSTCSVEEDILVSGAFSFSFVEFKITMIEFMQLKKLRTIYSFCLLYLACTCMFCSCVFFVLLFLLSAFMRINCVHIVVSK